MYTKFKPENPILTPSEIDTYKDTITKIFISLPDDIIPISGVKFEKRSQDVYYETVMSFLDRQKLLKNFNEYLSANSSLNSELLKELIQHFPDLKLEELTILNSYIINNSIPGLDANKDKIKRMIEANNRMKKELIKRFLNTSFKQELIKKYIDSLDDYSITLASINLKISKTPLDIYKIIKTYKLSPYVPFMMTTKASSDDPIIKYHKSIDKDILNDWVYSQNDQIKKPKGLNVKVFSNDKSSYNTLNISKTTSNIHLKTGFNQKVKYDEIKSNILRDIQKFLNEIKSYIPDKDKISLEVNIINFTVQIVLKKPVVVKKLAVWLRNNFMTYQTETMSNRIKFKKINESYTFNVKTQDNTTILTITQILNQNDIKKALNDFFEVLMNVTDAKIIINEEKRKVGQKKTRKLKDLKALGIFIKSADCQKIRHVDIYEEGKDVPKDSYILNYKDVKLYCKSKTYPYPGFTNSVAPCCFKKDQRNKEVYLRNTGTVTQQVILSDEQILRTNLITTNKILDANRAGVIPYFLSDLLNDDYLRIGVFKNSFINAVKFLTGKNIIEALSSAVDKDFYKTVLLPNNKILSEEVLYDDYVETLKTGKSSGTMKKRFLQNVLEKKLQTGIIVFKINFDTEDLVLEVPDLYWDLDDYNDYIFIFHVVTARKEGIYEPIVKVNKQKSKFQKIFKKNDDITGLLNKLFKKVNTKKLSPLSYEPPHIKTLLKQGIKIKSQLVNSFNKIEYIYTEEGIIPVKLTPPLNTIKMVDSFTIFPSFNKELILLKDLSKKYDAYTPVSVFKDKNKVNAILTRSGIIVPVAETNRKADGLKIINNKIPFNISNLIKKGTQSEDPVSNYMVKLKYRKELYEHFRFLLSTIINNNKELKKDMKQVIMDNIAFDTRFKAVKKIVEKLLKTFIKITKKELLVKELPSVRSICHLAEQCSINPLCKGTSNGCFLHVNEKMYEEILHQITTELFNRSDIFKGNIQIEFLDKNNFIPRNDEIILLNKDEIKKII